MVCCLECKFNVNGKKGSKRFKCKFEPVWVDIDDFPENHDCGRFQNLSDIGSPTGNIKLKSTGKVNAETTN